MVLWRGGSGVNTILINCKICQETLPGNTSDDGMSWHQDSVCSHATIMAVILTSNESGIFGNQTRTTKYLETPDLHVLETLEKLTWSFLINELIKCFYNGSPADKNMPVCPNLLKLAQTVLFSFKTSLA